MKKCSIFVVAICLIMCVVIIQPKEKSNTPENHTPKFQDAHSMDWDFIDENYLLKIAEFHGGTIENRAYTILVTLNIVWEDMTPIQDVVLNELYNVDGLNAYDFESISPSKETVKAMELVKYGRFDNSAGSTDYIEFYKN